jgi:predicted ATPase
MIISHVSLRNWKNFRSVDVNIGSRVFLVGPNACGKSNFLDVFRFLRDIAKRGGGLQQAVEERGGLSKIRCLAARQKPDVNIEVCLAEDSEKEPKWTYSIGIKQEPRGHRRPILTYERVLKDGQKVLERPDADDKKDPDRLTQTHLEQINANEKFRELSKYFEAVHYLHLVPQLLRHSTAFSGPGLPGDPFGVSFLERIAKTTEGIRKSRLSKIERALRIAVPQLSKLTNVKDEAGRPHLEAIYEHWRPQGARQNEVQFSDGTLRLIAFLWSLLDGDNLLLLEEPELSLNAGIVRKLAALIYRIQKSKKRQVILSTHSSELVSDKGIGGEEVLLLSPSREGTKIQVCSDVEEIRLLLESGLSIADVAIQRTEPEQAFQLELFS